MSERKVSTDALETLGTIHTKDEKRDAIHLAVVQVSAKMLLNPGESIAIRNGWAHIPRGDEESLAIVDPFLTAKVRYGDRFWAVLRPRLVTSLRHVWTHTAFPDTEAHQDGRTASEVWMDDFSKSLGITTETLMEGAKRYLKYDDRLYCGELFDGKEIPKEFWRHFEEIEKTTVPQEKRHDFLSCSC
jgi:hypothetical protein